MPRPEQHLAGRYELIEAIGSGRMAVVWLARELRLDRLVAVKILRPELARDPDLAARFETEARRAASFAHENVVAVYEAGVDGDVPFVVTEFLDGGSVANMLARRRRLDPALAVAIAASAARALEAAHGRRLIHGDVKPSNILLGGDGRARLADFGVVRALAASRVASPGALDSVPYMSPEQARGGEVSPAGDVFSLGVVLFEMLTGALPWQAETPVALATAQQHPAPPPSSVAPRLPKRLDAIVARALATDPAQRYATAAAFAEALESWSRRRRPAARGSATRASQRAVPGPPTGATAAPAARVERTMEPALAARTVNAAAVGGPADPSPLARLQIPRAEPRGAAALDEAPFRVLRIARVGGGDRRRPSRPAAFAAAADEDDSRQRRGELLLAPVAVLLFAAVALAMLGGKWREAPAPVALASPTAGPAAQLPDPTLPAALATPTPAPTVAASAESAATELPLPTEPAATPRPARTEPPTGGLSAPARAVVAFYFAVAEHDWDRAIDLWSPSMQARYPPDAYLVDRFRQTTQIDVTRLATQYVNQAAGAARVSISLVEFRRIEPSPRTFVGSWDLVRIDGEWKLDNPNF